jgi:hypothetical protein
MVPQEKYGGMLWIKFFPLRMVVEYCLECGGNVVSGFVPLRVVDETFVSSEDGS